MIYEPCECNGMSFICNRWVFTGDCEHRRERRVQEEMQRRKDDDHDLGDRVQGS